MSQIPIWNNHKIWQFILPLKVSTKTRLVWVKLQVSLINCNSDQEDWYAPKDQETLKKEMKALKGLSKGWIILGNIFVDSMGKLKYSHMGLIFHFYVILPKQPKLKTLSALKTRVEIVINRWVKNNCKKQCIKSFSAEGISIMD